LDPFVLIAVILSLLYAYWNGSNDCPNSIAAAVATGALRPRTAVLLAGIMSAAGLIVAGLIGAAVAKTIGKGIVQPEYITEPVILGGLVGAIAWAWFATWKGIPVSVTHSLIGGVMGAGLGAGFMSMSGEIYSLAEFIDSVIQVDTFLNKIALGILLAPLLGFLAGYMLLHLLKLFVFVFLKKVRHASANRFWRSAQVVSSSWLSFSHGMNDGQNAVGIIALAMVAGGVTSEIGIDMWMLIIVAIAMGSGAIFHGWKVIKTAEKITELEPIDGFAAQMASAAILTIKSLAGMPVSTTHVAVSGILGVGGAKDLRRINWTITRHIVMAWILTIPAAAIIGALTFILLKTFIY